MAVPKTSGGPDPTATQQERSSGEGVDLTVISHAENGESFPDTSTWFRILLRQGKRRCPTEHGVEYGRDVFAPPNRAKLLWSCKVMTDLQFPGQMSVAAPVRVAAGHR